MMKSAFRWSSSCLCFGLGLFACKGDPELLHISSNQAALTASENSERALDGLLDAADFMSESTSIAQALGALGGGGEELDESDLEQTRAELTQNVQSLVKDLRERILIPANLESETSTSATYRLGGDVLCDRVPDAAGAGGNAAEPDSECADRAQRLQLRLRLTAPAEGDVDVTVLLGTERNAPVVFELHQHSLGLKLDLADALAAARELGEDAQEIEQLSGVLELQLVENQPRDYSLELNVLEALKAVVHSGADTLSASLGASSPALELRADGNARRLLASLDLGALQVLGPLRRFADAFSSHEDVLVSDALPGATTGSASATPPAQRDYHGAVELFLAGLQGTLEYVADSDALQLDGLGFGNSTSFIKNDGHTLLALDLNAAQGRHVDVVLEPEGDGTKVSISPGFDLRLALAFHHIADQVEGIAGPLLDDTWHFWFEGPAPVVVTGEQQLRVQSGTLHLESSADPSAALTVSAGQCLAETASAADADASNSSSEAADWRHRLELAVCQ
jgi:hypothetical protein